MNNFKASGLYAVAEGNNATASGQFSHAEGSYTTANTACSHADGHITITKCNAEHASSQFNVSVLLSNTWGRSGNTLFIVGNGIESGEIRHDTFEICQNGDIYISDTNAEGHFYEKPMIMLQEVIKQLQDEMAELKLCILSSFC